MRSAKRTRKPVSLTRRVKRTKRAGSLVKAAQIAVAAPQVVAIRTARMLAAGANPGARDRAEFSRMGNEKVEAFFESMLAMGRHVMRTNQEQASRAMAQWIRLWTTPWWLPVYRPLSQALPAASMARQQQRDVARLIEHGLTPVHKRATANARRLGRGRKRS